MKNSVGTNPIEPVLIDKQKIKPIKWGNACEYWTFMDKESMGIYYEKMPPNTTDKTHFHRFSEQFLYVLQGRVGIELNHETFYLTSGQGILITQESPHKVFNNAVEPAEFILFASPNHPDDRVEV